MSNYQEYLKNISPSHVAIDDVYYFDDNRLSNVYEKYFDFCVENLNRSWDDFDIMPCYFYFKNDISLNASAAEYQDKTRTIEVNCGLLNSLYERFENFTNYLDSISEGELIKSVKNEPLHFLMFQSATIFLYYHELGHILQFSGTNKKRIYESYNCSEQNDYSFIDHVSEMYSDEFSANYVMEQVFYYFNSIPEENRTQELLEALISTNICSIFVLFEMFSGGIKLPIEYDVGDHPHEVIRIASITGLFVDKVSSTYNESYYLSSQRLIKRSFEILKPILQQSDSLDRFIAAISSDNHLIAKYSSLIKLERDKHSWMAGCQLKKLNI